jgi:hypothetical protein
LPERRLRVRLVADGSGDVNRQSYGLPDGEFITGLAPHIYGGPSSRSRPLATVHLHLPDVSAGYRKVGRLFDDQRAFRLGSHWLDSFSDPELLEPALVELRPSADGGVEQRLRDDLPAEYSVQAEVQGGARVLTLRRNERAFAHLVVEIYAEQLQPQDLHKEARARLRLAMPPEEALARIERAAEAHRSGVPGPPPELDDHRGHRLRRPRPGHAHPPGRAKPRPRRRAVPRPRPEPQR